MVYIPDCSDMWKYTMNVLTGGSTAQMFLAGGSTAQVVLAGGSTAQVVLVGGYTAQNLLTCVSIPRTF